MLAIGGARCEPVGRHYVMSHASKLLAPRAAPGVCGQVMALLWGRQRAVCASAALSRARQSWRGQCAHVELAARSCVMVGKSQRHWRASRVKFECKITTTTTTTTTSSPTTRAAQMRAVRHKANQNLVDDHAEQRND